MNALSRFACCFVALALCAGHTCHAAPAASATSPRPFVNPIFSDAMVLQRGKPNTLWGWSKPGDAVRVQIGTRSATGVADPTGRWQVRIDPPPMGGEYVVRIDGAKHVELRHVLVGDVWLCGGQSNMEFELSRARNGAAEVAAANHPEIRFFKVHARSAYAPADTPAGTWKVCSPQTVTQDGGLSAVAYFFARRVQSECGVPIGLIEDCLGGTPVECWMSPAAVNATGQFVQPMAEVERLHQAGAPEYGNYIMHWYDDYDAGLKGKWSTAGFDDQAWKTVPLTDGFAALGVAGVPSVVWFRRELTLPDPLPKGKATIHLGVVEKMDTTFINGRWVGASSWVENPRVYSIPDGVLKPGRNSVVIRVLKLKSKTGFLTPADQLYLALGDGTKVPLAGDWKAALSVDARPPHPLPLGYENYPIMPTVLYEGMIHPLVPLALTGALWYQGEANASRAYQYRTLLPAMIADWRRAFGQGDFPFLLVSLPAFEARKNQPGSDDWAELREAQALTAATVPNCGVAVTIDTGDPANIHPTEKQPVGERLARIALATVYGKPVVYRGPTYRSMDTLPHAIRVRFDHTDGGLQVHGDKLEEFSIAGADRQWHWADAKLDGDAVIVSSPEVPDPVAVRYAWQANPRATLFNGAGLPATPFRTDVWSGVTDKAPPW